MFGYSVAVQGSGSEGAVLKAIAMAAKTGPYDRIRAAYAYATAGGSILLVEELAKSIGDWATAEKRWLVSLDWGHTEPEALEYLSSLPNSQVRIPNAIQVLSANLTPRVCFHPKTLLLDRTRSADRPPAALAIGSANLTISGLRYGYEHLSIATWLPGRQSAAAQVQLQAMQLQAKLIDVTWKRSRRANRRLVADYRELRTRVRARAARVAAERVEDSSEVVRDREAQLHLAYPLVAKLMAARNLWVEIRYVVPNRGVGVEGNQIDLAAGTRSFFGLDPNRKSRNTPLGALHIAYRSHVSRRNMRFGNNSMDKLDLPIPGVEGPASYSNRVVRFERSASGEFRLTLGSPADVARWKRLSDSEGTRFRMSSGREWGVFG